MLGTLFFQSGDTESAVTYLGRAFDLDEYKEPGITGNYIEALRVAGYVQKARSAALSAISHESHRPSERSVSVYVNLALVEYSLQELSSAVEHLKTALSVDPSRYEAWKLLGDILVDFNPVDGEQQMRLATSLFPYDCYLHYLYGTSLHQQMKLDDALKVYYLAEPFNQTYYPLKANIAAALQSLGKVDESLKYYEMVMPHMMHDPSIVNNYGALMGVTGKKKEELYWLKKALELRPDMEAALVNMAGYYQGDGLLEEAGEYLSRAAAVSGTASLLRIRKALMLSVISTSWQQMLEERTRATRELLALEEEFNHKAAVKHGLESSFDHIHFYLVYHGVNDRFFQELVVQQYHTHLQLEHISARLLSPSFPSLSTLQDSFKRGGSSEDRAGGGGGGGGVDLKDVRRARVGFISKFFGLFEPHGMLLDGVMQYLPRSRFHVVALPVARSDGKPLAPSVAQGADEVYEVSLTYRHALELVDRLQLDVLVFADTMGEPITHFLAHARMAPIQVGMGCSPYIPLAC